MNILRKAMCLAVTAAVVLSSFSSVLTVRADSMMTAQEEVNAMNVGWNLGNTLDSYGTWINNVTPQAVETCWGNPLTTQAMIQAVRDRGFNTIRIPVTWAQFTDSEGNVDEAWMARVRQVVDWAMDAGLYVILNVHHDTGEHGQDKVCWLIADTVTYDQVHDRFANLWTNIANEFKDYGDRLMFEGYNEMLDMNNSWNAPTTGNGAYEAVNSFAQIFVDSVRATGGNNSSRNLIVNTYVASADPSVLSNFVLPEDSVSGHLIAEVHAYCPYQFCSAQGDSSYTSFDGNCQNAIDNTMNAVASFSDTLGVPVIIGEFGVENQNNDSDRASYTEYYMQRATERGIRCIWWDNGISDYGGYAILDRNSLSWNEDIASALTDNAPEGSTSVISSTETAAPEVTETSVYETSETVQTSSSAVPAETAPSAVNVNETSQISNNPNNSQSIHGNSGIRIILLILGALAVIAAYCGLFFLGRKNGKNE